jgi:hypothetical protein
VPMLRKSVSCHRVTVETKWAYILEADDSAEPAIMPRLSLT